MCTKRKVLTGILNEKHKILGEDKKEEDIQMGPSNSRGKLLGVSVIAHGSPD